MGGGRDSTINFNGSTLDGSNNFAMRFGNGGDGISLDKSKGVSQSQNSGLPMAESPKPHRESLGKQGQRSLPGLNQQLNPNGQQDDLIDFNQNVARQDARRGLGGDRNGAGLGGGGVLSPAMKQAGGLSLEFELPKSGKKLTFTKAGGAPKLALAIRPIESVRWGISLIWSAAWAVAGIVVLMTLRSAKGAQRVLGQLPMFAVVIGILAFFVFPIWFNLVGFALFLTGAIVLGWKNYFPVIVNE
jgi:hypothetical protein